MKKITCCLLCISLILLPTLLTAYSANTTSAALRSYYGDNMLFKQKDDVVLAGTASPGSVIASELFDSNGNSIAEAVGTTASDGTFSLNFTAPAGGYEEYTIRLTENGTQFAVLQNVVFGELWLAGGQSNMQMPLAQSETGMIMQQNGITGSDALRFLAVPYQGGYNGKVNVIPAHPIDDYATGATWHKGNTDAVYGMSAVGYFFAAKLIEELNMPVGVLNANLGGTSILTWLSREAIENDDFVFNFVKNDGRYIPLNNWKETNINFGLDMTCNFNDKIAPLSDFRLSGMIWYQGETDLSWEYGKYTKAFDLLQQSYTEHFSYKDGLLPIVYTQLASYYYGDLSLLQAKNAEFADMQRKQPDSRAVVSIYDVPLTYTPSTHAIHPLCKQEVGEKMAFSAMGLVYDSGNPSTAASPSKIRIADGSIYVTLSDVGDGLMAKGSSLQGFSVCGQDGIYVSANAEITAADTVRIYNSSISEPVSAAYAFSQSNANANLYATCNKEPALAVSPFVTNRLIGTHYWHNDAWTDFEYEQFWHCHSNEYSGFYDTWKSDAAKTEFTDKEAVNGDKSLLVCADGSKEEFSVSPVFKYDENGKQTLFADIDRDWSAYGTLSFYVKIRSAKDVEFRGLQISTTNGINAIPRVKDESTVSTVIPADGQWHCITLDLNKLCPLGNENAATYSANVLTSIENVTFLFGDLHESGADLYIDHITFTPDSEEHKDISSEPDYSSIKGLWNKIKAFFVSIFAKIIALFS